MKNDRGEWRKRGAALARRERKELLDVLDAEGQATGVTKPRHEVHRDGDWHATFHLWVMDRDDRVLIQRRSPYKDVGAGKLDVTVGGHLRAGESWPQALREADEELALVLDVMDVQTLGTFPSERRLEGGFDRERHETFAHRTGRDLAEFRLDPREVDVLYALSLPAAIALWRDGTPVYAVGLDAQHRPADALLHEGDLIPGAREDTVRELLELAAWCGLSDAAVTS